MESKDTMFELLTSLEQIVFKDLSQTVILTQKSNPFTEFEQLRKGTGLKTIDFAREMGVSVATVQEWESKRVKPSMTELKLMRLIQAAPSLARSLKSEARSIAPAIAGVCVYKALQHRIFSPTTPDDKQI